MTAQQLRIKSRLIERGSKWHIALSWYDENGNRSRTTVSTGIIVGDYKRGHKTEYDAMLETKRKQTEAESTCRNLHISIFIILIKSHKAIIELHFSEPTSENIYRKISRKGRIYVIMLPQSSGGGANGSL